jgi:hypothetical protein
LTLNLIRGLNGRVFEQFLASMADKAKMGFLVSLTTSPSPAKEQLLAELGPHSLKTKETHEWPGVRVPASLPPALLHSFSFSDSTALLLYKHCPELFGWQDRGLPCDLHLRDGNGNVLMGSITAENDAWLELSTSDWAGVVGRWPELQAVQLREV